MQEVHHQKIPESWPSSLCLQTSSKGEFSTFQGSFSTWRFIIVWHYHKTRCSVYFITQYSWKLDCFSRSFAVYYRAAILMCVCGTGIYDCQQTFWMLKSIIICVSFGFWAIWIDGSLCGNFCEIFFLMCTQLSPAEILPLFKLESTVVIFPPSEPSSDRSDKFKRTC